MGNQPDRPGKLLDFEQFKERMMQERTARPRESGEDSETDPIARMYDDPSSWDSATEDAWRQLLEDASRAMEKRCQSMLTLMEAEEAETPPARLRLVRG